LPPLLTSGPKCAGVDDPPLRRLFVRPRSNQLRFSVFRAQLKAAAPLAEPFPKSFRLSPREINRIATQVLDCHCIVFFGRNIRPPALQPRDRRSPRCECRVVPGYWDLRRKGGWVLCLAIQTNADESKWDEDRQNGEANDSSSHKCFPKSNFGKRRGDDLSENL